MESPSEYLKIKYAAPSDACKCGNCQLVPPEALAGWQSKLDRTTSALRDAERFMAYFAGETGGSFVGPGTPQTCLAEIRSVLPAVMLRCREAGRCLHGDGCVCEGNPR